MVVLPTLSVSADNTEVKNERQLSLQDDSFMTSDSKETNCNPPTPNKNIETYYKYITHFDSEYGESIVNSLGIAGGHQVINNLEIENDPIIKEKRKRHESYDQLLDRIAAN